MVTGAVDVIATQTSFCLLLLRLLYCFFHDGYGLSGVQTNQLLFPWWQNLSSVCVSYFVDTAWTVHSFPTAFPWWTRLERCTEQLSLPFDKAWAALRAERSYPVVSSCFYGGHHLSTAQTIYRLPFCVVYLVETAWVLYRPHTAQHLWFSLLDERSFSLGHLQLTGWCSLFLGGRSLSIVQTTCNLPIGVFHLLVDAAARSERKARFSYRQRDKSNSSLDFHRLWVCPRRGRNRHWFYNL